MRREPKIECTTWAEDPLRTAHHSQVVVTTQMATKLLTAEGKRVNFDTGDKAVLMPQLGQPAFPEPNDFLPKKLSHPDQMWQTAKTLRVALFRGAQGNEVRYAHVGISSDSDANGAWACFDIDVSCLVRPRHLTS